MECENIFNLGIQCAIFSLKMWNMELGRSWNCFDHNKYLETLRLYIQKASILEERTKGHIQSIYPPTLCIDEQFNSIFYFSELYNSEKHIHVIQYLNNRLDSITKTSLDYTIRWDSKTALLVIVGLSQPLAGQFLCYYCRRVGGGDGSTGSGCFNEI